MGTIVGYPSITVLVVGLLEFLVTVPVLKGKVGMAVVGVLLLGGRAVGLIVLIVGASRLARPRSVWARWMYDAPKAAAAWARFPDKPVYPQPAAESPGAPVPYPPVPPPGPPLPGPWAPMLLSMAQPSAPRPRDLTAAFWLLVAGAVLGLVAGGFSSLFVGILGPHLVLMRAGRRRSRTVAAVLAAIGAAFGIAMPLVWLIASPNSLTWQFGVLVCTVLLVGAMTAVALRILYRDPAQGYLRAEA